MTAFAGQSRGSTTGHKPVVSVTMTARTNALNLQRKRHGDSKREAISREGLRRGAVSPLSTRRSGGEKLTQGHQAKAPKLNSGQRLGLSHADGFAPVRHDFRIVGNLVIADGVVKLAALVLAQRRNKQG
jgi:hypothetical protein